MRMVLYYLSEKLLSWSILFHANHLELLFFFASFSLHSSFCLFFLLSPLCSLLKTPHHSLSLKSPLFFQYCGSFIFKSQIHCKALFLGLEEYKDQVCKEKNRQNERNRKKCTCKGDEKKACSIALLIIILLIPFVVNVFYLVQVLHAIRDTIFVGKLQIDCPFIIIILISSSSNFICFAMIHFFHSCAWFADNLITLSP